MRVLAADISYTCDSQQALSWTHSLRFTLRFVWLRVVLGQISRIQVTLGCSWASSDRLGRGPLSHTSPLVLRCSLGILLHMYVDCGAQVLI